MGEETRTHRRCLKYHPDAQTEAQKEDMSGETQMYGNSNLMYFCCVLNVVIAEHCQFTR